MGALRDPRERDRAGYIETEINSGFFQTEPARRWSSACRSGASARRRTRRRAAAARFRRLGYMTAAPWSWTAATW
jgi:hypothetical protein